jgi:RimJ/RimL family protein N-acetyltransferase
MQSLSNPTRPGPRPAFAAPADRPHALAPRAWWWPRLSLDDGQLSLTPLLESHVGAFLDGFRSDVEMANLTCMPDFTSEEQVRDWLRSQRQKPGSVDFAVMHQVHGFIGGVGAECVGRTAIFYFWIHRGVHGQGLGRQAARMLFRHLQALGFEMVAAFAWRSNMRSVRALSTLGMTERAVPPGQGDGRFMFFCRTFGN